MQTLVIGEISGQFAATVLNNATGDVKWNIKSSLFIQIALFRSSAAN